MPIGVPTMKENGREELDYKVVNTLANSFLGHFAAVDIKPAFPIHLAFESD